LSAFLGAIVMPLTFSKRPFWLKILLASFVLGIIYLLVQFLPSVTLARFSTIPTELSGGNLSQRIYIWQAGLKVVQDHFFFGVGAGAFPLAMSMFFGGKMVAHNAFLSVLAEEGVVGLVFFVLMLFSLLNRIIFLPSLERNTFLILIFTWIIGASSLTWDYVNQTWFLFSLTAAQISISGGDR
jgi:O-antigen ligase